MSKMYPNDPNFVPAKKPAKKIIWSVVYYTVGSLLSLLFILPLLYMIAASTKSEESIAFSSGTIMMFIPDFANITHFFDNYKVVFGEYDIWKYALNSLLRYGTCFLLLSENNVFSLSGTHIFP